MSTSTSTADPAAGRAACEPRTAFVLAGGAALGAMQAGMIHALYERGITPDLLIGTSADAPVSHAAAPARTRHALAELATPPPGPLTLVPPARTTRPRRRNHPGQLAIAGCGRIRAFARRVRAGRG